MRTNYLLETHFSKIARLLSITLFVAALSATSCPAGATTANGKSSPGVPYHYQHWLDEDARWIITPEERATFIQLARDEDRDTFIEHFWQQRNSITRTDHSSTFKEEHYRRLAYANEHFAAGRPGYMSDRGRIYIVYGPPDEIKVQVPADDSAPIIYIWHYNALPPQQVLGHNKVENGAQMVERKNVDLKFVDSCRCGEYLLQQPLWN